MVHLADVIANKYGHCATIHSKRDENGKAIKGEYVIAHWDKSKAIGNVDQPTPEQLMQDVQDYIANELPQKQAEDQQRDDLESERHTALELIARLGNDLDKNPAITLSPKTKALLNRLKAKLRS